MKILLIGPQGCGKSTQAKLLSEYLKVPVISTGDIFRKLAPEDQRIKNLLDEGRLIDDQPTARIVKQRLSEADCQNGFVLDGYPRSIEQIQLFDPQFDMVFYLELPQEEIISRLLKRGREDDTQESIRIRLNIYYQQTEPLIEHYQKLNKLIRMNGIGSIEEIQAKIRSALEKGLAG